MRRRWPWVVAALSLGLYVVAAATDPLADVVWYTLFGGIVAAFIVVGAILCERVAGNAIGPILLASGAILAAVLACGAYAARGSMGPDPWPLVAVAGIVNQVGIIIPIIAVLIGVPLIFPDGRLLSRRWWLIVGLAVAAVAAVTVSNLLRPGMAGPSSVPNPYAIPALVPLLDLLDGFASVSSIVGFGAAMLAVVLRYRRGSATERQQLKWLIAVAGVAAIAFPMAFLAPSGLGADVAFIVGLLTLMALPIAIGVAVTRYRLYDLDRLISRTLSWAIVTGLLVTVFVGLVVGLQAALSGVTQGQTLAVAASTLVAFALFQPVRRRVQRAVDERFDRSRVDGQRTADAFAERLRDEVDLESLAAALEHTVVGAIRPTAASLWLPEREPR